MKVTQTRATKAISALIATLIGIAFFFFIVGVFGLPTSLAAPALFVMLAILILGRPQVGEAQS